MLPSALLELELVLLLLLLFFAANNFFFSPSLFDLVPESPAAFRCINLMPIVALDNFFEDELPFFGVVPLLLFCCLEFGVVVASLEFGLAVPGFHIMI